MGDDDPPPQGGYLKCIKVSLKHVLKHYNRNQPKLNECVVVANKIVITTLQFMKLYLLDRIQEGEALPTINKKFVVCCMKLFITKKNNRGRARNAESAALTAKLEGFKKGLYGLQEEELRSVGMGNVLEYLAGGIVTAYENNIKQHYIEYVER